MRGGSQSFEGGGSIRCERRGLSWVIWGEGLSTAARGCVVLVSHWGGGVRAVREGWKVRLLQ